MKGVDPLDLMPSTSAGFSVSSELLLRARRRAECSSTTSVSAMLGRPVPWTPAWLTSLCSALHDALRPDHCPVSDRFCAIARQQVSESLSVRRCATPAASLLASVDERSEGFSTCRWLPRSCHHRQYCTGSVVHSPFPNFTANLSHACSPLHHVHRGEQQQLSQNLKALEPETTPFKHCSPRPYASANICNLQRSLVYISCCRQSPIGY